MKNFILVLIGVINEREGGKPLDKLVLAAPPDKTERDDWSEFSSGGRGWCRGWYVPMVRCRAKGRVQVRANLCVGSQASGITHIRTKGIRACLGAERAHPELELVENPKPLLSRWARNLLHMHIS